MSNTQAAVASTDGAGRSDNGTASAPPQRRGAKRRRRPHRSSDHQAERSEPIKRKAYEKELKRLQGELVKVQLWAKHTGAKIVVIFEGRDAAGKGGVIKALTERTSPRVFRIAALPAPSERERTQMYMQRYIERLPAGGEVILFDRSWYNRAGVEAVMGFAKPRQVRRFLRLCPAVERAIIGSGIQII